MFAQTCCIIFSCSLPTCDLAVDGKGSQVKQGRGILFREDGVPHLTSPAARQTKISSASNLLQWKVTQENKLQMLNVLFFSRLNGPQQDPSVGHS